MFYLRSLSNHLPHLSPLCNIDPAHRDAPPSCSAKENYSVGLGWGEGGCGGWGVSGGGMGLSVVAGGVQQTSSWLMGLS